MKWVKHVACRGRLRDACTVLVRKLEGKEHLGELHIDGRKILK
jgi:hypothetical protein